MVDTIGRIPLWIIGTVVGAVTSLTYYNRELYSGHADGSIKAWDIKGQEATLVRDVSEHKKVVTCFLISELGNCLLSGSADKTIKKRKLSDMLGPWWIEEDLTRFYQAYFKYGKDWKKVASVVKYRTAEIVEALYNIYYTMFICSSLFSIVLNLFLSKIHWVCYLVQLVVFLITKYAAINFTKKKQWLSIKLLC